MSTPKQSPIAKKRLSTFDQFRRFTTDAHGIERLLRTLQSLLQIILHGPQPPPLLNFPSPSPKHHPPLSELPTRFSQIRRTIRTFRFLNSFASAHAGLGELATRIRGRTQTAKPQSSTDTDKYQTSPPTTATAAGTQIQPRDSATLLLLDALSSAFDGIYYLLEALTLPSLLLHPSLNPLPPSTEQSLNLSAQASWFVALLFSALACTIRLSKLQAPAGVGDRGAGGEVKAEKKKVMRKLIVSLLDLALPGSALGWFQMGKGEVGWAMLGTSLLTGAEVWERCGVA